MLVDVWLLVVDVSVCLLLMVIYCVVLWLFGVVVVLFGCVGGIGDVFGLYLLLDVGICYGCCGWLVVCCWLGGCWLLVVCSAVVGACSGCLCCY